MTITALQRAYRGLSNRQTKILQVLAVNFSPVKPSSVVDIMKACGWDEAPTKSGLLTQNFAKQELQTLVDSRLVWSDTRSLVDVEVVAPIRDWVAQQSVLDGNFSVIADGIDLVRRPMTLRPSYFAESRTDKADLSRQARTAFYRGDADAYHTACRKAELQTPAVLTLGLMHPFDTRVFAKLPPALQIETLEAGLQGCLTNGTGSREQVAIIETLDELTALGEQLSERFGNLRVNRLAAAGDLAQLQQIADSELPSSELASGCLAFLTGKHEAAEKTLEAATKQLAKSRGQRNVILPILPGLMHLLLLLRKSDAASRRRLKTLGDAARQQWSGGLGVIGELVQLAAAYAQSPTTVAQLNLEQRLNSLQRGDSPPPVKAMAMHLQKWFRLDLTVDFAATLNKAAEGYAELGLAWLAALMEDAALVSAKSTTEGAEPGQCHEQLGTVPMLGWIDRPPLWLEKLGAIRRLAEGDGTITRSTPVDSGYDERMIWELDAKIHKTSWTAGLRPYVQKRSASGWSKGRPVALERLYRVVQSRTASREFAFLSDQDRDVCKCIDAEEVSTGYYRYTETVYNFRTDDALAALVGHPLIFAPGDRAEPLELTSARPQLVIRRRKDGFRLMIEPPPTHEDRHVLAQQGPKRYALVQYSKQQWDLADILGQGLTVPADAEQEVVGIVKSVAPMLAVQSDTAIDVDTAATADRAVESVAAETTPCLNLLPFRQGVRAEFFVRPFGDQGPAFSPGAGGESVFAVIGGQSLAARRDLKAESEAVAAVLSECPSLSQGGASVTAAEFPTADETLQLLSEIEPLRENGRLIVAWPQGQPLRLAGSVDSPHLRIQVKRDRDWFAASGRLALDDQAGLDLAQLAELVSASPSRFVPLSDGRFLALSERLHRRVAELAAFAERQGDRLRFPPIRAAALDDLDQWCSLTADKQWKQCVRRIREAGDVVAEVPSTLNAELRDYQIDGFRWLCRLAHWGVGACLADDMGLGKTLQAIALLLHRAADGPALVVAPTSVCFNWEQELYRFAPTLTPRLLGSGDRQAALADLGPRDVVISSYALMHNEAERLQAVPWHTAILDEAQAIKNTLTKRSRAAMSLQADFRMILTGTPIENHLGELWNLFRFINPGLLGSLEQFQQRFAIPIERDSDREARLRLKRLVQPFLLRRTKTQVLSELPPRIEVTMPVTMSDDEALLYEAARQRAVKQLAEADGAARGRMKILAEIVRLRRACCHPSLLVPECELTGAKLTLFSETIDELMENHHKALVFSQFVDHLKILREELDRKGISYQYLDGSTPAGDRRKRVEAFQNGEGDIFLISLKAGGTGLNLTAADYVLHMDPWWNPAVEDQAADRAHRLGQQRPVTIYRFITRDTIEEKIVALHETKRDLADSLLEGSDAGGRLSAEELLALIR